VCVVAVVVRVKHAQVVAGRAPGGRANTVPRHTAQQRHPPSKGPSVAFFTSHRQLPPVSEAGWQSHLEEGISEEEGPPTQAGSIYSLVGRQAEAA